MPVQKEYVVESKTDGLPLSCLLIIPDGKPKCIVQLVHGMSEYKERYLPFMSFLADNGCIAFIHDHRGHGRSVRSKEDLGYFYEGGFRGLVDDIYQMTEALKEQFGNELPLILFGHSMGSLAVRCYIQNYDKAIDKLIVCGSPSYNPAAGIGVPVAKLVQAFKGGHAHSRLLDGLTLGGYAKAYPEEGPFAWLNTDPAAVKKYEDDPYCGFPFTANGYVGLVSLTKLTYTKKAFKTEHPDLPIRFFSGEGDPCAVSPEKFQEAVQFLRDCGYKDVDGKMYKNMRHEILNEPGRQTVYDDMLAFIKA